MSEFQIALAGAGVVAVAAVWAYNLWQERQHKQLAEKIFKGDQPDVLLQGRSDDERVEPTARVMNERIEPVVSAPEAEPLHAEVPPPLPLAPETSPEPELADLPESPDLEAAPALVLPLPAAWVDEVADCTLHIDFAAPVGAAVLWGVQAAWAPQLTHALNWLACDGGQWRQLTAQDAGRCSQVAVSLQLADRRGPVSDSELAIFFDGAQRLAHQFGGHVEPPARHQVLAHAQALDGFCAGVDVQLGVNIVAAAGPFAGTKLRGLAEAAGLVLAGDGRFHARDDDGLEFFSVGNLGAETFAAESLRTLVTPGLTFVLDVPRVADGVAVFDRMLTLARQMTEALGGTLVDAQRHALGDAAIAGIRAKIAEIQQQMATHDILPGGPRALRLFN